MFRKSKKLSNKQKDEAKSTLNNSSIKDTTLYKCEPKAVEWIPKPLRLILAYLTVCLFTFCFCSLPFCFVFLFPITWRLFPNFGYFYLSLIIISCLLPSREWETGRKIGQLWYELFDFHCNRSPKECIENIDKGDHNQYIIGMHPHGIIPLQAVLWSAYCDQYCSYTTSNGKKKFLYGFGAAADVTQYLPFLRNWLGWLTAGSASYKALLNGLEHGISPEANRVGRKPKHLFILPGGVAEIFTSTPGSHTIVFKNRRGLTRLSLQTGAKLIPAYVFGGTDFYNNLATSENFLAKLSRKLQMGITIFYGPVPFLPIIPYTPKVTLVIGEPIEVEKWDATKGPIPDDQIEELHERYIDSIQELFERYKEVAGYPDAVLNIV